MRARAFIAALNLSKCTSVASAFKSIHRRSAGRLFLLRLIVPFYHYPLKKAKPVPLHTHERVARKRRREQLQTA